MLPLHKYTSKISFALILFSFILISCDDKSERNSAIITALHEGLSASNRILNGEAVDVLALLENKLNERGTSVKAKFWFPKAQQVRLLAKNMYDHIDRIKLELETGMSVQDFKWHHDNLFDSLMKFKSNVLETDPYFKSTFGESLFVFAPSKDTLIKTKENLHTMFFQNANKTESMAMLTMFQNNIRVTELKLMIFCNEQVPRIGMW